MCHDASMRRGVLFIAFLAACSSGGSDLSLGGLPSPAPSQVVARIDVGGAAGCATVPPFKVGQFSDGSPSAARAVKHNESEGDQAVTVLCRVSRRGDEFDLGATIKIGATQFVINDVVDAQGGSTSAMLILDGNGASWSSTTCKLDATGPFMGVAEGRYWAMLECKDPVSASGETCDVIGGELRIENCDR